MARTAWRKPSAIIDDLLTHAPNYSVIQALRIIEKHWSADLAHCQTDPSIAFPAADISSCNIEHGKKITLQLTCFGLCGVDSPLPHYLTEPLQKNDQNSQAATALLNIFNNRIYWLLYLSWKKRHIHQKEHLTYFSPKISSATQLQELLQNRLRLPIEINDCLPRLVPIHSKTIFGANIKLGDNTSLGDQLLTTSQHIVISVGAISIKQREKLLSLLRTVLDPTISFNIVMLEMSKIILGNDQLILGHCMPDLGLA